MKAVLDVHYAYDRSFAACVVFDTWVDSAPTELIRVVVPGAPPYHTGRFYERELPCLISVLQRADREFEAIVIDGYVHLRTDVGKGLGAYLFEALPYAPVVIGVAKTPLQVATGAVPIIRGKSNRPLFVSAIGCPVAQAAQSVVSMHGPYRIPTLLRLADRHARAA